MHHFICSCIFGLFFVVPNIIMLFSLTVFLSALCFSSAVPHFDKRSSHFIIKDDPFKAFSENIHQMKNIRIASTPQNTISQIFYYNNDVYLAHGYYIDTCLCGGSSSGAQCQKYIVEPTTISDDKIPIHLTVQIFNGTDCSSPATLTYRNRIIAPSGVSTIESDCDAGADLMDLPYRILIGGDSSYQLFGKGELNFLYGRKEDCSDNLFSSYFFSAARKCGYGPEVVCAQNSTYEVLDSFSVRVVLYNDNQCDTVANSFEYSFKDQQCQALSEQDKSEMSNFNTVMFQP